MESGPVMRLTRLAVNLIHHPDEPDGVETRDAATTATMTGTDQGGSASASMPEPGTLSLVAHIIQRPPPKSTSAEMHSPPPADRADAAARQT